MPRLLSPRTAAAATVAVLAPTRYAALAIAVAFASLTLALDATAESLTRGPYLQSGTASGVTLRWRTDVATDSVVHFGILPEALDLEVHVVDSTTEHTVVLEGLTSDTRYYYSVGSSEQRLAGGDATHYFDTSPPTGTARPTRIWALGDSGTANDNTRAVRDAFYGFNDNNDVDVMLMLGDNAYNDGTDAEYQRAVFDIYDALLPRTVLWSVLGNHDGYTADSATQSGPYYEIFSLPRAGEAGGVESGTEAYYSFDYANIHFVALDSYESGRSVGGEMYEWLEYDLSDTTQPWIIAFWHHPPYSKGSHDSDREGALIDMRENFLPLLEMYGVDLVLSGHSHSYERSYLIGRHYGKSSTFEPGMRLDAGDGSESGDGAYVKVPEMSNNGAVYVVAGSSGKVSRGRLNHPAMHVGLKNLGSMVIDVDGSRLDARFLRENGVVADAFTLIKGEDTSGGGDTDPPSPPAGLDVNSTTDDLIVLVWNESEDNIGVSRYDITRDGESIDSVSTASFTDTGLEPSTAYLYSVRAVDAAGNVSDAATVMASTDASEPPLEDTVTIDKALWWARKGEFRVEATSDAVPPAELRVSWAGDGTEGGGFAMDYNVRKRIHTFIERPVAVRPDSVSVNSSEGGTASKVVADR